MYSKFLKLLLFPASCASISVVHAKEPGKDEKCKIRASDLPLYVEEKKCINCSNEPATPSALEDTIRCARQELTFLTNQARSIKTSIEDTLIDASKDTAAAVDFLREENNVIPRYGAIAIGGLAGYILGLRRGFIKRMFNTAIGSSAVAAICYPNEAKEIADETLRQSKKYFIIGYHFLNGVTSDLTGYQLPVLPTGHFFISDKSHPPPDSVPSSAHLLPPTTTPSHIPLPHEDPHEMKIHHPRSD